MFKRKPKVFLDTETTGLSPHKHELLEFAGIKQEHGSSEVEILHMKILPTHLETASAKALEIVGYTEEKWSEAVSLEEAMAQIVPFLQGTVLVGHNVSFDKRFLAAAAKQLGLGKLPDAEVDTVKLARKELSHKGILNVKLATVCDFLGISSLNAHTALADAVMCKEVYHKLTKD